MGRSGLVAAMNDMRVKAESRLVRWAYLLDTDGTPDRTTVCALFWRTVLYTPVKLVLIACFAVWVVYLLGLLASIAIDLTRENWSEFVAVVITAAGAFASFAFAHWAEKRFKARRDQAPGLLRSYVQAVKQRVCPFVYIEKGDRL
jgi:hypothetical protein